MNRTASECMRLARDLEKHPCNRDGASKTWIVRLMRRIDNFFRSARKRHGSVR